MNFLTGNTKSLSRGLLGALIALITAFVAVSPAFAWTDTLTAGSTGVRKVHMDELRSAIYSKVVSYGFAGPSWTDPTITAGATLIRAVHITELQGQLNLIPAYFHGWCPGIVPAAPAWDSITAGSSLIRATDFQQLRNYSDSVGAAGSCCPTCRYPAGTSGCAAYGNGTQAAGCTGYTCTYECDPYGYNKENCYNYSSANQCNGAGSCVSAYYQTCGGTGYYCSGSDVYGQDGGCANGTGCTVSLLAHCTAVLCRYCSGGGCVMYTSGQHDACSGDVNLNCSYQACNASGNCATYNYGSGPRGACSNVASCNSSCSYVGWQKTYECSYYRSSGSCNGAGSCVQTVIQWCTNGCSAGACY